MSMKVINCKCCKTLTYSKYKPKKYCSNCSKFINRFMSRTLTKQKDRCRRCKRKLEAKYKYIASIREPCQSK